MSRFTNIQIDLLAKLEYETVFDPKFSFNSWASHDTDRLKKIVVFLERAEKEFIAEYHKNKG